MSSEGNNLLKTFTALIEDAGSGGAYVRIPFDVEKTFGKKRVKVRADIEGETYRGSLVRMGSDFHILGIRKDIRQKIGKCIGDTVRISLEEDRGPREVAIPPDLMEALSNDAPAHAAFLVQSYSHQKEYVQWIEEAKHPQTRQNRITRTLEMLKLEKPKK